MKYAFSGGFRCPRVHTKFHKDWFRHSEVNRGDTQTAWRSHKSSFIFAK
jgi:hypothetical protein